MSGEKRGAETPALYLVHIVAFNHSMSNLVIVILSTSPWHSAQSWDRHLCPQLEGRVSPSTPRGLQLALAQTLSSTRGSTARSWHVQRAQRTASVVRRRKREGSRGVEGIAAGDFVFRTEPLDTQLCASPL